VKFHHLVIVYRRHFGSRFLIRDRVRRRMREIFQAGGGDDPPPQAIEPDKLVVRVSAA
jgi:hypothetical protein